MRSIGSAAGRRLPSSHPPAVQYAQLLIMGCARSCPSGSVHSYITLGVSARACRVSKGHPARKADANGNGRRIAVFSCIGDTLVAIVDVIACLLEGIVSCKSNV